MGSRTDKLLSEATEMTGPKLFYFDVVEKRIGTTSLVSITLARWTENNSGDICITPEMTIVEIDANIQHLKDQLDLVAKKAKTIAQ